jgi:hypothetical protein
MQVKIMLKEEARVFYVNKKEDSYRSVFNTAYLEFKLQDRGITKENARLRSYNVPNSIMQDTYTGREDQTLEELRIYSLKTLALEVKESNE